MELIEGRLGPLYEPLTQRERNILAHLAKNRTSPEIAQLETLATSSVKWYIHQIYAKLGVNQRGAAVNRARQLGLLSPTGDSAANLPAGKHNLPRQLTSFIGRKAEIATLLELVQRLPLVTLTGSGGTGKTRLALQVAERSLPAFAGGTWWVGLAPLMDPDLVPLAAAAALGLREIPREAVIPVIIQFIGGRNLLLVLDNCEHLSRAVAKLAGQLLAACPRLHILATSREVLGLPGEKTLRCPPLATPDPQTHPTQADLAQFEAVCLFVERAQNVAPDFRLTQVNGPLVAQVCHRLDGIPLAIELAAARTHLLSMEQITDRLKNVFYLLTGGARAELPRHQTLKALVDWSYSLLSDPERLLLCRLSVFTGSWTLAAVEVVCADSAALPAEMILTLLGQLVDKSLVEVAARAEPEPHYRMLEMIRQYAHQRLLERGGLETLREQHLDYYLALGLQAEQHLRARGAREWRELLETELDNLRLAWDWSLSGSVAKGLRLAAALQWFWHGSLHRGEGVDWLNRLLAAEAAADSPPPADPAGALFRKIARGKALNTCFSVGSVLNQDGLNQAAEARKLFQSLGDACPADLLYACFLGRGKDPEKSPQEFLEAFRRIGQPFFIGEMLLYAGGDARLRGEFGQARRYFDEWLQLARETGDLSGESGSLWNLGMLDFLDGNPERALAQFQASQACCEAGGDHEFAPLINRFYAWVALASGDVPQAIHYSQLELDAASAHFSTWMMSDALGFLGWAAFTAGDLALAQQYCEKALQLAERSNQILLATARYVLARVALARGNWEQARAYLKAFLVQNSLNWPPAQLGLQLHGILAAQQMAAQPTQALRAATFFGSQTAVADSLLRVIPAAERELYRQAVTEVRAALSPADFAAAWAAGEVLTFEQAIAYALAEEG